MKKKAPEDDPNELSRFCSMCGRPHEIHYSPEWLLTLFRGMYARVLAALIEARRKRKPLSLSDLCHASYPTVTGPSPVPVGADNTVTVAMMKNAAKLATYGWAIVGPRTTGVGFMLVPLES